VTTAAVVRRSDAIDAAFCSATRSTFVGSIDPRLDHVDVGSRLGVEALRGGLGGQHLLDDDGALTRH